MRTFVQVIKTAEKISTKKEKHAALHGLSKDGQRLVREALDTHRVFGVKKYDLPARYSARDADAHYFFDLLDRLHDRELTGNSARETVTSTLSLYTEETAKYLMRVLGKDLKCGASADTFNEIYTGLVPTYPIMLAQKMEPGDEKIVFKKPRIGELKYDGQRVTMFINSPSNIFYESRGGKPADKLCGDVFVDELLTIYNEIGPFAIDGEVIAGTSYNDTMQAKKTGADKSGLLFFAYDIMSMRAWVRRHCRFTQKERSKFLEDLLKKLGMKRIIKSEWRWLADEAAGKAYYAEVMERRKKAKAAGQSLGLCEGLIIKEPDGLYEWDRSPNWLKWKPVLDVDAEIIGFYAGRKGTRLEDTVGGINVRGIDENGHYFESNVGSGFDDDTRNDMLKNPQKYLHKMCRIECKEMSLAKNSTVYSLREPVYCNLRPDLSLPNYDRSKK